MRAVVLRLAVLLLVLWAARPAPVAAHDSTYPHWEPSGWDTGVLTGLGAVAALHLIGTRRLVRRGARMRRVERAAFWIGWAALAAAVAPPLDRAAAARFSSHMAQHELLMLIGAPLLIVGRPVVPVLWALPERWRHGVAPSLSAGRIGALWGWLTLPIIAWALHGATVWIWHLPVLYEAAVRNEALHALQHTTLVATAVFFWWGLVYGRYGRLAYGASVLYVFTTSMHTGILGALFMFSSAPSYPLYAARAVGEGIDPLMDQQLAGIYMWVPAGMVFTLFGLALMLVWLSESERRAVGTTPRIRN